MQGEISEADILQDCSYERILKHFFGEKAFDKSRKAREKRLKQIKKGLVVPGEVMGEYLIHRMNPGCIERARKSGKTIPCFNILDVTHLPTEEDRVLKTPNPALMIDRPDLEFYLQNEWRVLSRLNHRNIIKAYRPIQKRKVPYLPLEYLPYQLHEIIGKRPALEGIVFFALEAATAMQCLEQEGVVHGDIKPQQFMAGHDPEDFRYSVVKLLDFGAARHPDIPPVGVIYTPAYLAPETKRAVETAGLSDEEKVAAFTHKSDIFALGLSYARVALSSEMASAEVSILFAEPGKAAKMTVEAMYDHHLPYLFNRIIEMMIAEDPDERIDADEVVRRFQDFMLTFNLGPKTVISKNLYSGKVLNRSTDRPY
ncbi:protein kinase [Candidatus Woesearchaeota archaeon]|nr:protein kinase [Candidatus Woesearchaeota archaeon]